MLTAKGTGGGGASGLLCIVLVNECSMQLIWDHFKPAPMTLLTTCLALESVGPMTGSETNETRP